MTYVGVDWAGGLWVVVELGDEVRVSTEPSILNVWAAYGERADATLVDIPIGLPETDGRACDRAAQELLSERSSTVFSVPSREVVQAEDYESAVGASEGSLGSQSWWLFPRIKEVDVFLREIDDAVDVVYESHPEVCFATLGDGPLPSKNADDGLQKRVELLGNLDSRLRDAVATTVSERAGGAAWHDRLSKGRRDDVVDAAVLAGTAAQIGVGRRDEADGYPALPRSMDEYDATERDPELDIPMEIVHP